MAIAKWFWVGGRQPLLQRLTALFGREPAAEPVAAARAGDVVVVDSVADGARFAPALARHAFGAVRALKETKGLVVYVVVDEDDRYGVELARFCLADGVMRWRADGALDTAGLHVADLAQPRGPARGRGVDELLRRLEANVAASGRGDSPLQRLLQFEREDSLLNSLQDPETGLFDGPYATLKLDEEWKRAMRFHQPLSLLLIDLGAAVSRVPDAQRRAVLADASGVFLNECRDIDVLARFAPTVFLLLLPGTGAAGAEVLATRILAVLRDRLRDLPGIAPACGVTTIPSADVPDRKAFLGVAEACLRRAQAGGAGGVCTTWQ